MAGSSSMGGCMVEVLLFSYGTLQLPEVQRATFGRLLEGTPDALVGFERRMLRITDEAVLATSGQEEHPIVSPCDDPAKRVAGMVFTITEEELAEADSYEVAEYTRIDTVLASGKRAFVYVKRA